jgi:hypothetical protein
MYVGLVSGRDVDSVGQRNLLCGATPLRFALSPPPPSSNANTHDNNLWSLSL